MIPDPLSHTVINTVITTGVKKIVDSILHLGGNVKSVFGGVDIRQLASQFEKLDRVRTIAQPLYDQSIRELYFQLDVTLNANATQQSQRLTIASIDNFPEDSPYIYIEGLAGQGKSTLLKQLATSEIVDGYRLPIFLEFRKMDFSRGIEQNIAAHLADLGIAIESDKLKELLSLQQVVLMLDGFDEVPPEQRHLMIRSIDSLIKHCTPHRLFITSRPNAGLEFLPLLDRASIEFFTAEDAKQLVQHLCGDVETARRINSKITARVEGVLVTPLLVTLLILTYKSGEDIPDTLPEFYQNLFYVMVKRHDSAKADFIRPRKSGLGDHELQKLFSALSFVSFSESKTAFLNIDLLRYMDKAIGLCNGKETSDPVIDDIVHITNLILEDGIVYEYVHKSIQEYYAACFLYARPEKNRIELYTACKEKYALYAKWRPVLDFLSYLDPFNYAKYLALPSMENFYQIQSGVVHVNKRAVENLLEQFVLAENAETFIAHCNNYFIRDSVYPEMIDVFQRIKMDSFSEFIPAKRASTEEPFSRALAFARHNGHLKQCGEQFVKYKALCTTQEKALFGMEW